MSFDLVQPANFIVGIIKIFGLWRLDTRWEPLYRIYSFLLHFICTFALIVTLWGSIFTAKDLEQFTESLYMSLTEMGFIVKITNMVYYRGEAIHFFELIKSAELVLKNSDEKVIFKRSHRTFDLIGKFYVVASACVVGVSFTVVAFGSRHALPFPAWMPFELNSETFWYAYVFQLVGMVVTCFCNVCIDLLQCYYMHHLSLIYRVIGYRLSKIGFDIRDSSDEDEVNRKVLTEITETVKIHQFTKRVTKKCERMTSCPFFMQVLLSALALCFTGYQLQETSPLDKPGQFVSTADFLLVLGLQIFLPCYYSNQVTLASGKLTDALYNSNWVELPQKSKKLIYLYMIFLREPIYIKAGVFFNIGIPIFAKTINNAYSYFAVLVRMKN